MKENKISNQDQEIVPYGDYDHPIVDIKREVKKEPKGITLTGMEAFTFVQAVREGEFAIAKEIVEKRLGSLGY